MKKGCARPENPIASTLPKSAPTWEPFKEARADMPCFPVEAEPRVTAAVWVEDMPTATTTVVVTEPLVPTTIPATVPVAEHHPTQPQQESTDIDNGSMLQSRLWCEPCQKQYTTSQKYYQHLLSAQQHFPCRWCCELVPEGEDRDRAIFTEYGSSVALDAHIGESEHRYCVPCKKPFLHSIEFALHEEECHESEFRPLCMPCDQTFLNRRSFARVCYQTDIAGYRAAC